jgi:hypothetical protein
MEYDNNHFIIASRAYSLHKEDGRTVPGVEEETMEKLSEDKDGRTCEIIFFLHELLQPPSIRWQQCRALALVQLRRRPAPACRPPATPPPAARPRSSSDATAGGSFRDRPPSPHITQAARCLPGSDSPNPLPFCCSAHF